MALIQLQAQGRIEFVNCQRLELRALFCMGYIAYSKSRFSNEWQILTDLDVERSDAYRGGGFGHV